MVISVTELKTRLLEVIREVEREGKIVEIERHGKVVARLIPSSANRASRPWERLRGTGTLAGEPGESVLDDSEFEANR